MPNGRFSVLSMEFSVKKWLCILLVCVLTESAVSARLASSSSVCERDFEFFLHDLNSQCPFPDHFASSPIQVDGETFEKTIGSSPRNVYTAVLFYASWCPFSTIFQSKFSMLSSMYPQIKHLMVEQTSAMPSVFARYGIHSVPSLLIVNQTTRMRYHGRKDLQSLISFYRKTTGLRPVVDMVEETPINSMRGLKASQIWNRGLLKENFLREPYLVLSVVFVLVRAFLFFYPEIASRFAALWAAYIPRLNLVVFGESRQFIAHVLHQIDVKRIWTKLKNCKTRNLHRGARNARVWASSLASVSLGEASSSRARDL